MDKNVKEFRNWLKAEIAEVYSCPDRVGVDLGVTFVLWGVLSALRDLLFGS